MDEKQIEFFKIMLTQQLENLFYHNGLALSELKSQNGQEIEYIDRASIYTNQVLKLRISSRESRLIKKIQVALERIENNTYGICESCEEEISLKRLEARPVTTKCIHCKEAEENYELLMQ